MTIWNRKKVSFSMSCEQSQTQRNQICFRHNLGLSIVISFVITIIIVVLSEAWQGWSILYCHFGKCAIENCQFLCVRCTMTRIFFARILLINWPLYWYRNISKISQDIFFLYFLKNLKIKKYATLLCRCVYGVVCYAMEPWRAQLNPVNSGPRLQEPWRAQLNPVNSGPRLQEPWRTQLNPVNSGSLLQELILIFMSHLTIP